MDIKITKIRTTALSFTKKLAAFGLIVSSTAMASDLHPIEDISLVDTGDDIITLKAKLLMNDSCVIPSKSTITVDNFSGVINLNQSARDPEVFCTQVITERESDFIVDPNQLRPGEYELIDAFGKKSLGTLYIGPNGSTDLFKENAF